MQKNFFTAFIKLQKHCPHYSTGLEVMKIYNKNEFILPRFDTIKNSKQDAVKENKSFSVSSLEALGNIKKADLTISFKGNSLREPADLTVQGFENYATEVDEKISKIKNEKSREVLEKCMARVKENCPNYIFILDRIASNECLYNNSGFITDCEFYFLVIPTLEDNSLEKVKFMTSVMDKVLSDKELCKNRTLIKNLYDISKCSPNKNEASRTIKIIDKVSKEKLYKDKGLNSYLLSIILIAHSKGLNLAEAILDKKIYNNNEKFRQMEKLIRYCDTPTIRKLISNAIRNDKFLNHKEATFNKLSKIIQDYSYTSLSESVLYEFLRHEEFYTNPDFIDAVFNESDCLDALDEEERQSKVRLAKKIFSTKELIEQKEILCDIARIMTQTVSVGDAERCIKLIDRITGNKEIFDSPDALHNALSLASYMDYLDSNGEEILDKILNTKRLISDRNFIEDASWFFCNVDDFECHRVLSLMDDTNIAPIQILMIAELTPYWKSLKYDDALRLNQTIGIENASKLSPDSTYIALSFLDIYAKEDLEEIPDYLKKELLNRLLEKNSELFFISPKFKKMFPLLPVSREEYCDLLPKLVKSIGVKTNNLSETQIKNFNSSVFSLGCELAKLSNEKFNDLKISQKYSKDDFILDVLSKTSDIPQNERLRIFNYFGFDIIENNKSKTGYSIIGYPVIKDEKTDKKFRESLNRIRENVDKFLNNNPIECENKKIENKLNKVISALPELRTLIGKVQSGNIDENGNKIGTGSHDFDVFKHSLKVMQRVVQNSDFITLDDSDKKVMLLASLLHDITKKEGQSDGIHPEKGSFDAYYISKKFKLTPNEEYKLYTLIKTHEWLAKVNNSKNEKELNKNLKSTAYDLRHYNLLQLSGIFTHADLMAVRKDDSFHDKVYGRGRTNFKGETRSFGESADKYISELMPLVKQIKRTQPILPVTKIPSASRINRAITRVNEDGSTNLKGIYKDKDGLIIIKYNEVENIIWEKIGFSEGSVSKGIKSITSSSEVVNTGNIKFFIHGLDTEDQLANFDMFSLLDSDALLSVSYAERPESKYRFFRPQGIILDCPTKFIHGGGKNDMGSGMKKNLQIFKDDYIFEGSKHEDRLFISDLIRISMGMSADEYIKFVQENEDKSFSEIEPKELRNKIINVFASINSNKRFGNREYNEIFITNPNPPMAVYAYSYQGNEKIKNPVEFLNRKSVSPHEIASGADMSVYKRTEFLRKYALKRDIPFFIFGE